ncbi:MAG: FecR domain-containing protein [Erythrobacter sp.]
MPILAKSRLIALLCAVLAMPTTGLAAKEAGPVVYRMKQGDNLNAIAKRYLKRPSDAQRVQRFNRIANPRRIPVNMRLRIPRNLLSSTPVRLEVFKFSGRVLIDGKPVSLKQVLREDSVITTQANGFVTLQAKFGGKISLPSNSSARLLKARRYKLDRILDVDFKVLRGRGSASSPTLKGQDSLRMRTNVAVTAVRGTEFRVAHDEAADASLTEVVEGEVGVAAGGEERATPQGFGVPLSTTGIGPTEELLPAPELVEAGRIQTGKDLSFELMPVAGATAYRLQIAKDPGFLDIVSEKVVEGNVAQLEGLNDGRYNVRARGIAASGIEGLSQEVAYSFRRKRAGVSGTAAKSPLLDGFRFDWVPEGEGTSAYAFQLWRKGELETLLVDETGLNETSIVLTDLANGTYNWRVAVMQAEAEGLLKVWGETKSLVVSD